MIGTLTPKKKHPKSTGPHGKLDARRWIIITLRNNGAQEAQFPLPVTVNSERIVFDRDEPVIAPAYYLDTIDNCILPKYESIGSTDTVAHGQAGQVRSEDDAVMVELKYITEVTEIPDEYQTIEGIQEFVEMLHGPEVPPEFESLTKVRFGQTSFNQHNYAWSNMNKVKEKPKKPGRKTESGDTKSD